MSSTTGHGMYLWLSLSGTYWNVRVKRFGFYKILFHMSQPQLFVIVLNNNRFDDTSACLASLFDSDYENMQIVLLDNASSNEEYQAICSKFPGIQAVSLDENLGYAGNNNIGIKMALEQGADWILILNDDTVLEKDSISSLIYCGEMEPSIGVVGPIVFHFDEPNVIQSAGGTLGKYWNGIHIGQNDVDQGQYSTIRQVDWISGCAIMVRREMIEQVGMLNPNYFLYGEEIEWCIRAKRANWQIICVPSSRIWHKGVRRDYLPEPYVTYYMTRNHLFTLSIYDAPMKVWVYTFIQIFRSLISWSIKPKWRFKRGHRDAMWRGLVDFLRHRQGPMASNSIS